jgi:hypothetical protein
MFEAIWKQVNSEIGQVAGLIHDVKSAEEMC